MKDTFGFMSAVGKNVKGYRAFIDIGNGKIGISPEYSRKMLEVWIDDNKLRSKLVAIMSEDEYQKKYGKRK